MRVIGTLLILHRLLIDLLLSIQKIVFDRILTRREKEIVKGSPKFYRRMFINPWHRYTNIAGLGKFM